MARWIMALFKRVPAQTEEMQSLDQRIEAAKRRLERESMVYDERLHDRGRPARKATQP